MSRWNNRLRSEWLSVTLSANQNNYNPNLIIGQVNVLRVTCSGAPRTITGLTGGVGAHSREMTIINVGSNALTLADASVSSSEAHRFAFGGNLVLAQYESATLVYDDVVHHRWLLQSKASVAGGGLEAVSTDGDSILGDGTPGDPLTVDGGIGAPYWIYFSLRSGSIAGGTNYFALAQNGSIGSGGFTPQDATNTADAGGWAAGFALQLPKGELSNFFIGAANGPGVGETVDLSIRLNAADPADGLAVQLAGDSGGAAVFVSDIVHTVAVPASGYVAIKAVATGGASFGGATGRVLFTPKP